MSDDPTSCAEIARALWSRGLSVIPVPRPRRGVPAGVPGDGKTPMMAWREYQTRLPTEAEIYRWFATQQNIAVITGAVSGFVIVDADDSGPALRWCTRRLPYTPWQTKTARGFHLWFLHPGGAIPNRSRIAVEQGSLAVDVRGDGGYVIAPSSVHATGVTYEFAGDWNASRDELPRFQREWLQPPASRSSTATKPTRWRAGGGDRITRAARYLASIPRPEIGQGSDRATFCAACCLVRGFALGEADAAPLIWHWAGNRAGWTREWVTRKVHHAVRYGTGPIGSLLG